MIRRIKASLGFIEDPAESKPPFGSNAVTHLGANSTIFTTLPVTLAELTAVNNKLLDEIAEARTGSHEAVARKNAVEMDWNDKFRRTARYVSEVADGLAETIYAGGFVPTKGETTPTPPPETPQDFVAKPAAPGCIDVKADPAKHARAYVTVAKSKGAAVTISEGIVQVQVGDVVVYIYTDTHEDKMLNHLPSDERMEVSMFAFNNAGASAATQWQEVTVQ